MSKLSDEPDWRKRDEEIWRLARGALPEPSILGTEGDPLRLAWVVLDLGAEGWARGTEVEGI